MGSRHRRSRPRSWPRRHAHHRPGPRSIHRATSASSQSSPPPKCPPPQRRPSPAARPQSSPPPSRTTVPRSASKSKLAKTAKPMTVRLEPTEDIAAVALGKRKRRQLTIGFAMEDHAARPHAVRKLHAKNCDAIVLNGMENVAPIAPVSSSSSAAAAGNAGRPPQNSKSPSDCSISIETMAHGGAEPSPFRCVTSEIFVVRLRIDRQIPIATATPNSLTCLAQEGSSVCFNPGRGIQRFWAVRRRSCMEERNHDEEEDFGGNRCARRGTGRSRVGGLHARQPRCYENRRWSHDTQQCRVSSGTH